MPPLMLIVNVAVVLVIGVFASAAVTMAHAQSVHRRKARQKQPTLGRMNPHAMQRFLDDLANPTPGPLPFPFKDWRDTPDPYGIPDEEPTALAFGQAPEPDILIRPAGNHQTYFGVQGDDARLAAVVIAHSTGPSEHFLP